MKPFAGWPGCGSLLMAALLLAASPAVPQTVGGGRDTGLFDRDRGAVLAPRRDVLIGSSGYHQGELQGCSAQGCAFDGTTYPRAAIVFLGLGVAESDVPPAVEDYTRDSVHLRGAPAVQARLLGINADSVVTERGSFPRQDVAWVFLAPAMPTPDDGPGGYGAPPPPPSPPSVGQPPAPPIGQPPEPPADSASAAPPGFAPPGAEPDSEPGALWTGWMELRESRPNHATFRLVTTKVEVRLRETRPRGWQSMDSQEIIDLVDDGSIVTVTYSELNPECSLISGGHGRSSVEPEAGYIERNVETFGPNGEKHWSTPVYKLRLAPTEPVEFTASCPDRWGPGIVQGGGVPQPAEAGPGLIPLDRGRMVGSWNVGFHEIRWAVCRERVACTLPPGTTQTASQPPPEMCPEPKNETALLDLALDQQKALSDRLAAKFDEYFRLANEAREHQAAFEHASTHCLLWTAARVWATFVLSNFAPTRLKTFGKSPVPAASGTLPPAQYKIEPGKEFANFLGFVEKVLDNDGSWALPNAEFKEWASVEDAYDAFTTAYGNIRPGSYAEQVEKLRNCGAPTHRTQMDGAIRYLRLMEQVEPLMQQVNELLNDLRKKDEQLFDLWNKYYAACLEYANCKQLPARTCEALPSTR